MVLRLLTSPGPANRAAVLWRGWIEDDMEVLAPTLLYYEVANALHRYKLAGELSAEEATSALDASLGLGIVLHGDAALHRLAVARATALGLKATYDAHYLALAERLAAPLWTFDAKLVAAVHGKSDSVRFAGA